MQSPDKTRTSQRRQGIIPLSPYVISYFTVMCTSSLMALVPAAVSLTV